MALYANHTKVRCFMLKYSGLDFFSVGPGRLVSGLQRGGTSVCQNLRMALFKHSLMDCCPFTIPTALKISSSIYSKILSKNRIYKNQCSIWSFDFHSTPMTLQNFQTFSFTSTGERRDGSSLLFAWRCLYRNKKMKHKKRYWSESEILIKYVNCTGNMISIRWIQYRDNL